MLLGFMVMIGWIFDIAVLKSILPVWVTMKFSTALSFCMSGFILFMIEKSQRGSGSFVQVALTMMVLGLFLLMGNLLASSILGIRTGIEDLFVKEAEGAVKTTTPGRPSVGTMVNFILMAVAGIVTIIDQDKLKPKRLHIGWVVGSLGRLAVVGYIINQPLLYYTLEGVSTAMAAHTAILFVLLGLGLILSGRPEKP